MKRKLVSIEWIDAHGDAEGWTERKFLDRGERRILSVGFLLPKVKRGHVSIAQSYDTENKDVTYVFHIPKSCVIRIRKLRQKK